MQIGHDLMNEPTLAHVQNKPHDMIKSVIDHEHYELLLNFDMCGEDMLYVLVIRRYWNDDSWNHYWFGNYVMGQFIEAISEEEYAERRQNFIDNEGEENILAWYEKNDSLRKLSGIEHEIKAALIRRWEALCELVHPNVTF